MVASFMLLHYNIPIHLHISLSVGKHTYIDIYRLYIYLYYIVGSTYVSSNFINFWLSIIDIIFYVA